MRHRNVPLITQKHQKRNRPRNAVIETRMLRRLTVAAHRASVVNISREHSASVVLRYAVTERSGVERRGKLMRHARGIAHVRLRELVLTGRRPYFFDATNIRRVIGTRIYSCTRARSQLVARPFIFHVARDRSSLTPSDDLWKLIETCIHHRSIGKLSASAAYRQP